MRHGGVLVGLLKDNNKIAAECRLFLMIAKEQPGPEITQKLRHL